MSIDCMSIPPWLKIMRAITGMQEEPGTKDNPRIIGMRDWIACTYYDIPGLMAYAETYQHDDTPWCSLCAAFCLTVAGYIPPFKAGSDTDCYYWAQSFASDPNYVEIDEPALGAICVMTREGGGHVTLFEGWANSAHTSYKGRGGNQSDSVNIGTFYTSDLIGFFWPREAPLPTPAPEPEPEHDTIEEGSVGEDVEDCQRILGLPMDGEFGPQTDGGVKGFQAAMGLDVDGCVGPATWAELEKLDQKMIDGTSGLDPTLEDDIIKMAKASPIHSYSWRDRGRSPPGYIAGMACCFAVAMQALARNNSAALAMAQADREDEDTDALTWFKDQYEDLNMDNSRDGIDTLRHLFVMIIGLSMRESSGNHWEGRDQSASNTSPDSAEAGLDQTSWDIKSASPEIPKLFNRYWDDPNGFREIFSEGLSPSSSSLQNYGKGAQGTGHQWLSKYCPAYHVFMTAIGLRYRRQHWGPVNRHEVELKQAANDLLIDVQNLVEASIVSA